MATQEDSCGKVLPLRPATGYGGALPGMRHPGQFETTWSRRALKSMWPLRQIGALPPNMSEGFLNDIERSPEQFDRNSLLMSTGRARAFGAGDRYGARRNRSRWHWETGRPPRSADRASIRFRKTVLSKSYWDLTVVAASDCQKKPRRAEIRLSCETDTVSGWGRRASGCGCRRRFHTSAEGRTGLRRLRGPRPSRGRGK